MAEITSIFGASDPIALLRDWLAEAERSEPRDANAMSLATVDADGVPDVRVVLLKEIEAAGLVFYTNYTSRKGQEIEATGKAAIVLHWKSLGRQIRARGYVERVEGAQADAYYASRGIESRLGAWASRQSQPLDSRETLLARVEVMRARHGDTPPRPPFWGGYRIIPDEFEFWADGEARLHDRERWVRQTVSGDWNVKRLSP